MIDFQDRVAVITLNRPEALNAWNGQLSADLDAALTWAAGDDDIGAVVITGAGRAFCAGADLSAGGETFRRDGDRGTDDDARIEALEARDAEVEFLRLPDEGHWLQKWQSNVRLYRTAENFLATHLGGRKSPLDAVELWLGLQ